MRGHGGCDFPSFGHHHHPMGPFGHFGPGMDHGGCGSRAHHGPRFEPGYFRPGPPSFGPFFGHGPSPGEESDCCQDSCGFAGFGRRFGPGHCPPHDVEHPRGPAGKGPGCSGCKGKRHGPPPHCERRRRDRSGERSPCREDNSPCRRPHDGEERPEHGPRHKGPKPCKRCSHRREGHHGFHGPDFGPFRHFGPHRRPFGPWNRHGPFDACDRRGTNSDEESGNESERHGRKNGPCSRKDKHENRDETILVQRIVVEKEPRCYSV